MRVVNIDATSYQSKSPKKCLENAEKAKKNNYLNAFLKYRQHFIPFVFSLDVLLVVEAEVALKLIASRLLTKWK